MTDVSERAAPPPPVDDCVYDPFYQFHGTPPATATTTTTHPAENMCDKVTPGGLRITVKNTACRGDSTGGTADRVVVNSNISTPSSDVKRGECNAAAFSPVRAVAAARQLSNALNGIAATERSTGRGDETTRSTPASSCIWPLPTTLQPGKIKQPIKMLPLLCLTL